MNYEEENVIMSQDTLTKQLNKARRNLEKQSKTSAIWNEYLRLFDEYKCQVVPMIKNQLVEASNFYPGSGVPSDLVVLRCLSR